VSTAEYWTIAISVIALILSVTSFTWQVFTARRDAPRVIVRGELAWSSGVNSVRRRWAFTITVINVGRTPITVDDVAWVVNSQHVHWRYGSEAMHAAMPVRLEGHDSRVWQFEEIPRQDWIGQEGWPVVTVVDPGSFWRRRRAGRRQVRGATETFWDPRGSD
jgi:hypothetical protein